MTNHRSNRLRAMGAAGVVAVALGAGALPAQAIVNGKSAVPADVPHFADVRRGDSVCGGTVVDANWVLTAAHCLGTGVVDPASFRVRTVATGSQFAGVTAIVVHPLWNGEVTDGHDLALLQVPSAATSGITPVQVGTVTDSSLYAAGRAARTVGRGTDETGTVGNLRVLDTSLHSDDTMDDVYNRWWTWDYWRESLHIGAGSKRATVCNGDSGGPLTVSVDGRPVLVGVTSFGWTLTSKCAQPGAFAEVRDAQLAWIGTVVPAIRHGWGWCQTRDFTPGKWSAAYQTTRSTTAPNADGSRYWGFTCVRESFVMG